MALNTKQQLNSLIETGNNILVVFPASQNGDVTASALALQKYLQSLNKQVDVASSSFHLSKNLKFLPGSTNIKSELTHLQKFIVKVDVKKAPIENLSYEVKDNWLSIYLTPKTGAITRKELRTAQTTFKYDLIITLGANDLNSLGEIFLNNTDIFFKLPIINIDRQASNENFGQLNFVNLTATSIGEVVFEMLREIKEELITADIATSLLTGMIIATRSFRDPAVTPHTLNLASELINHSADREKIIKHLYRTRSVAALKLWGTALSHLEHKQDLGIVYTSITRDDFTRAGATPDDIPGLIDELISTTPEAKMSLLLYELNNSKIKVVLVVDNNFNAVEILSQFSPQGNKKQATVVLERKGLKEAEELILKTIKKK